MMNANSNMVISEAAPAASPCARRNGVAETLGFGSGPALDWRPAG
jgi:hypothetical protein